MKLADQPTEHRGLTRLWLPLSVVAALASASHVAIDFAADVYPSDLLGYLLVGGSAIALYLIWIRALNRVPHGSGGAATLAATIALIHAGLANGLVGFFPCPPVALWGGDAPCSFAPWQDLAHLGSFVFGITAFTALRRLGAREPLADRKLMRIGLVVLATHVLLSWVAAAMS